MLTSFQLLKKIHDVLKEIVKNDDANLNTRVLFIIMRIQKSVHFSFSLNFAYAF